VLLFPLFSAFLPPLFLFPCDLGHRTHKPGMRASPLFFSFPPPPLCKLTGVGSPFFFPDGQPLRQVSPLSGSFKPYVPASFSLLPSQLVMEMCAMPFLSFSPLPCLTDNSGKLLSPFSPPFLERRCSTPQSRFL